MVTGKQTNFDRDSENLLETIDDNQVGKILICAKATKQIVSLVTETDFCFQLESVAVILGPVYYLQDGR
jgi:hypothetical protein